MKNWILILLITAVSLTISLYSGALNWLNQFVICGIIYLLAGLLYAKKFKISRSLYGAIVVLPFLSVYSVFVFVEGLSHVYPIASLPVVSIFAGLFFNKMFANGMSKSIFITQITTSILIILLLGYFGMPNWLAYSFSEKTFAKFPVPSILLTKSNGESFNLNNQPGKILVLDFWSTSCGICLKKFPDFDKLKQEYTSQTEIEFYAVNLIHRKEQLNSVKKVYDSLSYSFENLYTDNNSAKQIRELLRIEAVPTIVIIDKNSEVVYLGDLNVEQHLFIDNIHDIIESAITHY